MPQQEQEIFTLTQEDFSGGVNIVENPVKLTKNELSDARNFVIDKTDLRQRYGYTQYNSSAIGGAIRSSFQFKNHRGDQHLVVQADDGKIYLGSASVPTAGSFSELFTETSGSGVACFTEVDHKLIMTNGVDVPQVYEGTYGRCGGFVVARGGSSADVPILIAMATINFESDVTDEVTATYASLGALTTIAAHGDRIYVGSKVPTITGFRFVFGEGAVVNTNAVTITVRKFTGATWTTVGTVTDGTLDAATSTKTFNRTGDITFAAATTEPTLLGSQYRYWFMITLSGALSNVVNLTAVYLMYPMQALPLLWNGTFQYPTQVSKTVNAGSTYTDYTSAAIDSDVDTVVDLSSLDTYANGDFFVVGYSTKFSQVWMQPKTVNTAASVLSAEYWNGIAWTALPISDGTQQNLNGKTLSNLYVGGTMVEICFVPPTDWFPTYISSLESYGQYLIRFSVSAALSADVKISEVRVVPYPTPLIPYKFCLGFKDRLFLAAPLDESNRVDVSGEKAINDFLGADSDELYVSSNRSITAFCRFYNEVFISTSEEIFLLQGYSPTSFSLLRIETDNIGSLSQSSVVSWGKILFFVHSSGFYAFDGTGIQNISKDKVNSFFDSTNSAYFIPLTRLPYIQGRWNPLDKVIEWSLSMGSTQATNNFVVTYNPEKKAWMFHDFLACFMGNLIGSNGETQAYHGDYDGRLHQANAASTDNGTAITSYITTRGFSGGSEHQNLLCAFRGLQLRTKSQDSGVLVITQAQDGLTTFSAYCTMSMIGTRSFLWMVYNGFLSGLSVVYKILHSTSGVTPTINEIRVPFSPIREEFSYTPATKGIGTALVTVGLGIEARTYLTLEEADAVAHINGTFLIISQDYVLTANTVLASSVLRVPGGSFTKDSTYTLSFTGKFQNLDDGECFIGFDPGDVTFGSGVVEGIRPEWYGGKGDNLDASAAANVSAFAQANGSAFSGVVAYGAKQNILLNAGTYKVTATIGNYAITVNCPIKGEGPDVSMIKNIGAGSAMNIEGVTGEIHDSHFSGFTVQGNASSEDGITLNATGALVKAVGYSIFDNVYSTFHGRHGLVHRASWGTKYNNCKFNYNGGLNVYTYAEAVAGTSYHNNIIFKTCDARWGGSLGNATGNFLKGGARFSGNGTMIIWDGGVVESNNAWDFIIGCDTTSLNSFLNIVIIKNVHMEDTPTSAGASTIGGNIYADENYGQVEISNNHMAYFAPTGGTGYAFYVNHTPEYGSVFKEWGNKVVSSGSGTAIRDYGLTYDWKRPLTSNILQGGTVNLLTAAKDGKWQIGGFIHVHNTGVDDVGIFPWTAAYDSVAGLTTHVGSSLIAETLTDPTLAWDGSNNLILTIAVGYYGFVEMRLGTGTSPPSTLDLPSTLGTSSRNKLVNGNFDLGDSTWTKDAGWTIVDQGGGDYEGVATNAANNAWIYQVPSNMEIGRTYRLEITCSNYTDGKVAPFVYGGVIGTVYGNELSGIGTAYLSFVQVDTPGEYIGAAIRAAASDLRVDDIALYLQQVWPDDLVKRSYP